MTHSLGPVVPNCRPSSEPQMEAERSVVEIDGIAVKQKYIEQLPKSRFQLLFLRNLSRFACVPSGSSKPFLNSGSLIGAYSL